MQPYLPDQTPKGLRGLREKELADLRGNGKGVRKLSDKVYDFDVYNDLGNPDRGIDYARPMLGGEKMPYPRRCRTGRGPTVTGKYMGRIFHIVMAIYTFVESNSRLLMADMEAESRVEKPLPIYVPRDEQFEESKQNDFSAGRLRAVLHNLLPQLKASISAHNRDLNSFSDIDSLYKEGLLLKLGFHETVKKLPKMVTKLQESSEGLLKYETPKVVSSK